MKRKKMLCLMLICLFFLPVFSSCQNDPKVIRYNLSRPVYSLDPQFSTDPSAALIIVNCFEGLFKKGEDGKVTLAAAESYEVSEDRCTYTFHLRQGLVWNDGTPLTAKDFAFALTRMFNPSAVSPNASQFTILKNAQKILSGELPVSELGVRCIDDYTLVVQLEQPSPYFTELLTTAPAMPCNEEFLNGTMGRYGLEIQYLKFNGCFEVSYWNNSKYLAIRKNYAYHSPDEVLSPGVNFYFVSEEEDTDLTLLLEERVDAAPLSYNEYLGLSGKGFNCDTFDNTIYSIVFNLQDPLFSNQQLRTALCRALDRNIYFPYMPDSLQISSSLVPPSIGFDGASLEEITDKSFTFAYDPDAALQDFESALSQLGINRLGKVTMYCPEEGAHFELAAYLQQMWNQNLGTLINLKPLPTDELLQKVQAGDYQLAIVPFTPTYDNPESVLGQFVRSVPQVEEGQEVLPGAEGQQLLNDQLNEAFRKAGMSADLKEAAWYYKNAEDTILQSAAAFPLYYEASCFAYSKDVSGIVYSPFSGQVFFSGAVRQ